MDELNQGSKRVPYAPQTIGKVLMLLDCFSVLEPRLSANEIGAKLGLNTSTLYRYLTAMEQEGYLEKEPETNKYVVGLRVVELAGIALSRLEVRRHGQLELDSLAGELNMNTNLGVLYCGDIFHLAFSVRTEVDKMYAVIGRRTPAHCTAMGKVILAGTPKAEVHQIIGQYGWRPLTENSIQDFERLDAELDDIRLKGYALDRGEVSVKGACVAAPVYDQRGRVIAAISASSTKERVEDAVELITQQVCHYAEKLSIRLGYHGGRI